MKEHSASVKIDRKVRFYESDTLGYEENKWRPFGGIFWKCDYKQKIRKAIPSIEWLSAYDWKECLLKDTIAGITVAIMNIPQGMGYALLGNVSPVVGIYMAVFPVIVYAFLDSVVGSFAVVCLMTGDVVSKNSNLGKNGSSSLTPIQVATSVAFFVGAFQIIFYCLRFGVLSSLLSDTLVSGFTSAAAIHVVTSQIKDILGIEIRSSEGPFSLIFAYESILLKIPSTNPAALAASAITFGVLIANSRILTPFVKRKTQIPIPIELIIVVIGTALSYYTRIHETYSLKIVGDIPEGLPKPNSIHFSIFPRIALSSLLIAIVAYVVTQSMALIFANKLKYEVDANQELLAQGCANLVGSFFSCMPIAASLSRSAIQQTVGGRTQLASLVSAPILILVLLWIAPIFKTLPRCVLASLIVFALRNIVFQVKDLATIWRISKSDSTIFLSVYVAVILVDIDFGLFFGVLVSLLLLICRVTRVKVHLLERVPATEIYLKTHTNEYTERVPRITIIHYEGSINFINKSQFKEKFTAIIHNSVNNEMDDPEEDTIILDFTSLIYVDLAGANTIKQTLTDFDKRIILFVGIQDTVLESLRANDTLKMINRPIFPTVHDAVVYCQDENRN